MDDLQTVEEAHPSPSIARSIVSSLHNHILTEISHAKIIISNKRRCWQQNNNDIAHTTTNPTAGGKTTLVDLDVYDIMNSASTSRHLHHTGALPGFRPRGTTVTRLEPIPRMPNHSFISWTFGRGAVVGRFRRLHVKVVQVNIRV